MPRDTTALPDSGKGSPQANSTHPKRPLPVTQVQICKALSLSVRKEPPPNSPLPALAPARKQTESPLSHSKTSRHQQLHRERCSKESVKSIIKATGHRPKDQHGAELHPGHVGLLKHGACLHGGHSTSARGHDWLIIKQKERWPAFFPTTQEPLEGRDHIPLICCKTPRSRHKM